MENLGRNQIQLWCLHVDTVKTIFEEALAAISEEERERARRFRVEPARSEFVFGRYMLRRLLSSAFGVEPRDINFAYGPRGKPTVQDHHGIDFNVSHSAGQIVVAVSRAGIVGVDVEHLTARFGKSSTLEVVEMAGAILRPEEAVDLRQSRSSREALDAFYQAWTMKEALAKAEGSGIASHALYKISRQSQSCYFAESGAESNGEIHRYVVRSFTVATEYIGALAARFEAPMAICDGTVLFS